jgi:hypothetical protein
MQFVPPDLDIPTDVETERFRLHPLRLLDSDEDYASIMADYADHVRNFYPEPDLRRESRYTKYMNERELGWHEVEFLHRTSFTYVIRGKDDQAPSYRGCVYVFPTAKVDYDAEIYLWVTSVDPDDGLYEIVLDWAKTWASDAWGFSKPLFPYHVTPWDDYDALPEGRTYEGQHWL